jgi:hypothetical protein
VGTDVTQSKPRPYGGISAGSAGEEITPAVSPGSCSALLSRKAQDRAEKDDEAERIADVENLIRRIAIEPEADVRIDLVMVVDDGCCCGGSPFRGRHAELTCSLWLQAKDQNVQTSAKCHWLCLEASERTTAEEATE